MENAAVMIIAVFGFHGEPSITKIEGYGSMKVCSEAAHRAELPRFLFDPQKREPPGAAIYCVPANGTFTAECATARAAGKECDW